LISEHEESIEMETLSEFDQDSENFNLDQIIDSVVDWASSSSVPHLRAKIPNTPSISQLLP